jgi:hypothetical protein
MNALTWEPILSNLMEAHGELKKLLWRLHYLTFGELPEDCPNHANASELAWYARPEERNQFAEGSLFVSLEHAYYHLNWAWNCRRTPEERVWHFSDRDADRWTKFPNTMDFADLWPADRTAKDEREMVGSARKVNLSPVRMEVQIASRKLEILRYLVAKEIRDSSQPKIVRPRGLKLEVGAQPLTEKEFANRMHRIYEALNMAWNSRMDKAIVTTWRAIKRRSGFSLDFSADCYNMWRQR